MRHPAVLWVLVLFLGTSVLFRLLGRLTADASDAVTVGTQVAALAAVVVVLAVVVRRRGPNGS